MLPDVIVIVIIPIALQTKLRPDDFAQGNTDLIRSSSNREDVETLSRLCSPKVKRIELTRKTSVRGGFVVRQPAMKVQGGIGANWVSS